MLSESQYKAMMDNRFDIDDFNAKYRPNHKDAPAVDTSFQDRGRYAYVYKEAEKRAERSGGFQVYRGPRGGKYRVVNKLKRYDVA